MLKILKLLMKPVLWRKINIFLGNPLVGIIVGVLITVLFFFFVEKKEVDPRYYVSDSATIAQQTLGMSDLSLYWGTSEIEDISSVSIVFWNAGRQYLGQDFISDTEPIRVIVPRGIQVLYAEVTKTSRPSLNFILTYLPSDDDRRAIQVEITGDDVLEKNDGGILRILYTGSSREKFGIGGRVFGTKNDFLDISSAPFRSFWNRFALPLMLAAFIAPMFLIIRTVKFKNNNNLSMFIAWYLLIILLVSTLINLLVSNNLALPIWATTP